MAWKRRVFLLWLAASSVWIVFAFLQFVEPQMDEVAWTVWDVVDCLAVLCGLPLACLGTGVVLACLLWEDDR